MTIGEFFKAWGEQSFIAADQAVNAIVTPIFTWQIGMADETLSARTYRAATEGKIVGRAMQPVIDLMFAWQAIDPTIKDEAGNIVTKHCERAFFKEKLRRNLPPEYR